eukprot:scaffold141004_cov163-Phaeocystis_antarctica.AAC.1
MLESAEARPIVSRPLLHAKSRKFSQKVEPTLEVVRAQSAQDRILAGFGVIRFHRHPYLRLGEARAAAAAIGTRDPLQNALPRAAVVWAVCTPTLAVCALPPSLSPTQNTLKIHYRREIALFMDSTPTLTFIPN